MENSSVLSEKNDTVIFDSMAKSYDNEFTDTLLGRLLRNRVWDVISQHFKPGDHILEINCGTGEDAIWMAKKGFFVTATDASAEMIKIAKEKLSNQEIEIKRRVSFQQKSFDEINTVKVLNSFDGVLSDFGGINTISEWKKLSESLAEIMKPRSTVILVPMGKWCFWEMIWFSLHLDFKKAFRRFNQPVLFKTETGEIKIWYPTYSELKKTFSANFQFDSSQGMGIFLPPSYLKNWVDRFPGIFKWLDRLDRILGNIFPFWGDHYILVMRRK